MRRALFALAVSAAAVVLPGCGSSTSQTAGGSVHPPGWGTPAPLTQRVPLAALALGTTATMFDTVTVSTVPRGPFALAGYTAGHWPTFLPLRKVFPGAHVVSIAIAARFHADCLDVEPGDASPGEVVVWYHAEKKAGWPKPCIYSDWSQYTTEIFPALERAGIHRWQIWKWDADYTFRPHIDRGFDGTQYTDTCLGRNLDCSVVLRSFLSIAHPPLTASKPKPPPRRLKHLEVVRANLRVVLLEQHCRRIRHPSRHCLGVLHTGARVNKEIRAIGGH